ncbi:hypothetical protein L249_4279, partial [Ophiocordyceps polyrhachis-furcata BCC 54312]
SIIQHPHSHLLLDPPTSWSVHRNTNPKRKTLTSTHTTQLPLGLLNAAQGQPMLVELKNGETLNGHLVACDTWMNLTLRDVVQTSPEGDKFLKLKEAYVKGNNIKYLRVPDEIMELVSESQKAHPSGFRGGRGGQSRGDHGGRGGDRGRSRGGGRGRGRGRGQ